MQKDNKLQPIQVDIGFDIGIASVGWCVTRVDNLEIVLHGARTFDTVDEPKSSKLENETRREKRSLRRQISRRATLRRDFIKLAIVSGLVKDIPYSKDDKKSLFVEAFRLKYFENRELKEKLMNKLASDLKSEHVLQSKIKDMQVLFPYLLRKKALSEKLSLNEILIVLYWYIHHRGYKYDESNSGKDGAKADSGPQESKSSLENIEKYRALLKSGSLPVKCQLDFYSENGHIRGSLNRIFHSDDYENEIRKILEVQKLDLKFSSEFLKLFKRQRSFEQGPGGAIDSNSLKGFFPFTPYGRYYKQEGQKIIRLDKPMTSVWEKTVGHCSIYPLEKRAPKNSMTSQLFNFLNDINNLRATVPNTDEITSDLKFELIDIAFETKSAVNKVIKKITDFWNVSKEDIAGFRIDKKGAPLLTSFDAFHAVNSVFKKLNLPQLSKIDFFDSKGHYLGENIVDDLANILAQTKTPEIREQKIRELFESKPKYKQKAFSNEAIKGFSDVSISFADTHSLSYKAMKEIIKLQIVTNDNSAVITSGLNLAPNKDANEYGTKYLELGWASEIPNVTPTVKRALRQSILVLNDLLKMLDSENYKLRDIVVEMAREHNNEKQRKAINDRQKYFEELNAEIEAQYKEVLNTRGLTGSSRKEAVTRLWLAAQQNWKDAYTGEPLGDAYTVATQANYDIDHIIPRSQSFDDSRSNRVLTSRGVNSNKGNRTPFQFLGREGISKMEKLWREWYLRKDGDRKTYFDNEKFMRLISEKDFGDPANRTGFIGRNLVDTQWATKAFIAGLAKFAESSKRNFIVRTVNGKETSWFRSQIFKNGVELARPNGLPLFTDKNKKSRVWYGHHAEDAFFTTVINHYYRDVVNMKVFQSRMKVAEILTEKSKRVEHASPTKPTIKQADSLPPTSFAAAGNELNSKMDKMLFSRMVKIQQNTQLFNETLYKGGRPQRKEDGTTVYTKFKKIELSSLAKKDCEKYFGDTNKKVSTLKPNSKGEEDEDEATKGPNSLECYRYDRKMYEDLKAIYLQNFDEKNPFDSEMKKTGINYIPIFDKDRKSFRKVKKLTLRAGTKAETQIIKAPSNGNSFYDSFDWIELELYKTKKNTLKLIPINAFTYEFKKEYVKSKNNSWQIKTVKIPKTENINLLKKEHDINLHDKPLVVIQKGDIIAMRKEDGSFDLQNAFYVSGSPNSDVIELKYINREKTDLDPSRLLKSVNPLFKTTVLLKNCDFLGKNCSFFWKN